MNIIFIGSSFNIYARSFDNIKKTGELRICYTPWIGKNTPQEFPNPYFEMAMSFSKDSGLKAVVKR
jgi:hypothetical protein